jgi:DNA-binding transcriptional MerR regulator
VAGRRVYGPADLSRVAEIQICKDAGFRLEELRELFDAADPARRRALLHAQLERVRERIARLTLSATLLEHGLRCRHDQHRVLPAFPVDDPVPARRCAAGQGPRPPLTDSFRRAGQSARAWMPSRRCTRSGPPAGRRKRPLG